MLDPSRLRTLHAVAVHGSISAAATALSYTPSAVSQQIAKLERETRTSLLERHSRGVRLTDAAEHLVDVAKQLTAITEAAESALEQRRGQPAGTLTIATAATAGRELLPGVLASLAASYPSFDVRTLEATDERCTELVARGAADLALAHDSDLARLPVPGGVEKMLLGEDTVEICTPAAHPLTARGVLTRQDLIGQRWITQPDGDVCHSWVLLTMRSLGHEPDIAHRAAEAPSQLALVAAGLGIALMGRLGRGSLPAGVVAVPLEPAPVRRVYALWRTTAAGRPAITATLRLLRAEWDTFDR